MDDVFLADGTCLRLRCGRIAGPGDSPTNPTEPHQMLRSFLIQVYLLSEG